MWIYGAGGYGNMILDCIEASSEIAEGFIDDDTDKKEFMDLPVSGSS